MYLNRLNLSYFIRAKERVELINNTGLKGKVILRRKGRIVLRRWMLTSGSQVLN